MNGFDDCSCMMDPHMPQQYCDLSHEKSVQRQPMCHINFAFKRVKHMELPLGGKSHDDDIQAPL